MTETVVRFEPRGAVLEAFRSKAPELCLSGAAGTGKTVGALMKIHLACLQTPGVRALIARKTLTSLTSSTLVTFRKMVAREALEAGLLAFYGGSAQEPASYRYGNGSVIVVGGLDRPSRLLSTDFDLAFVDEAVETEPEDLDIIITRLRHGRLQHQQLILCTNPGAPTHHLKRRCDAGRTVMLYSKHEDNPRLYQDGVWTEYGQTYLDRLDSLVGVRYERMRLGRWVASEGQVYAEWDESVHLVPRQKLPPEWTRIWGVDFGFVNPEAVQCWAIDPDDRMVLEWELYFTQRTQDQHARSIMEHVTIPTPGYEHPVGAERFAYHGRTWTHPKPRTIVCDHDAEGRAILERELGMSTVAAHKAVKEGIEAMQVRLRPARDGRPRLVVMRDGLLERDPELVDAKKPTCLAEEVPGYVWDEGTGKSPKDQPLKADDHAMDCARYVCAELDLAARPRIRML